jgi:hypothetical protein
MLNILLDYRWWIDHEEDSCESICGSRAVLASPTTTKRSSSTMYSDIMTFYCHLSIVTHKSDEEWLLSSSGIIS